MERSINKFLDLIDNLDFRQEYQIIYIISVVKTRLNASKRLYEEMKRININNDQEVFDSFEEENRMALMESILSSLEIIQDGRRTNNITQNQP